MSQHLLKHFSSNASPNLSCFSCSFSFVSLLLPLRNFRRNIWVKVDTRSKKILLQRALNIYMSSERSTFLWVAQGETVITQVYNLPVASPWSLTPAPMHKVSEAHHVGLSSKNGHEEMSRCLRLEVGVFSGEFWWLGFSWNGLCAVISQGSSEDVN